jgi:cyclopropane-fatty-acyl-phospholipid synthase
MTSTQRVARRIVTGMFSRITTGRLEIREPGHRPLIFGSGGDPWAVVDIRDSAAWTALLRGSRGMAESYVEGHWDTEDLVAVVRLAARNVQGLDEMRQRWAALRVPYQKLRGVRGRNTVESSKDDISRHYDMGNDFFELMLDGSMMYSSGHFAAPGASLHDAQLAKLELVCSKLDLSRDDHVVEIGTGWGGFAVHAAATRGCRVTTTTISKEQHAYATRRVREAGLQDRVTILLEDYRDLKGSYDKLVSLEMIEAVGWRDFPTFFAKCSTLLEPDGAMVLQAITMDDRAYEVEKASRSFIRTKIFPNGALPSQEVIARCLSDETDMRMTHHQDLSADYVRTLAQWRENVEAHTELLASRGYDERFRRLWRMYLCYCEGGFAERRIGVGQSLLAKPHWRGPVPNADELALDTLGVGTPREPEPVRSSAPAS